MKNTIWILNRLDKSGCVRTGYEERFSENKIGELSDAVALYREFHEIPDEEGIDIQEVSEEYNPSFFD